RLGNVLEETTTTWTKYKNTVASAQEIDNRASDAIREGLFTRKEWNKVITDSAFGSENAQTKLEFLAEATREHNFEVKTGAEFLAELIAGEERLATIRSAAAAEAGITAGTAAQIAAGIPGLLRAPVEIVPFFEGLDPGILSAIQAEIEKGEFLLAGGEQVQETLERAQRALDEGRISMERYLEIARNVEQQAIAIQVETGKITLRDAALERMKEYGGTIAENEQAILDVIDALKVLDGMKVRAFVDVEFSGVGTGAFVRGLEGPRAAGGPVTPDGTFLVGERGPELFSPNSAGNIIPNNQLGGNQAGADMSVLEGKLDKQTSVIKSALLDIGQMIAERG
ncbi:hypothetical protein LCGC14_1612940, partial [marine sediment metagenome]